MNRYPVWKYAIIVIALLVGIIYTLPNFYGEAPAVRVASVKATVTVDRALEQRVETLLADAGVKPLALTLEAGSIRARFDKEDEQLKAPVIEPKRKRDWGSIFQKTFDKINKSFTAAEDEEI